MIRRSDLSAWMQLARLPNLPTVPGDVIAGYLLGGGMSSGVSLFRLLLAVASVLCLYVAGLILNDCVDVEEDRIHRPDRPLPSGAIAVGRATMVGGGVGVIGVLFAFVGGESMGGIALVLVGLIGAYDVLTKGGLISGSITMGACRAAGLIMGAVAGGWRPSGGMAAPIGAGVLLLYIASVTAVGYDETENRSMPIRRWLPAVALLVGFPVVFVATGALSFWSACFALLSVLVALGIGHQLGSTVDATQTPECVGRLIRNLLSMQAAVIALVPGGWWVGIMFLLAMRQLSVVAAKRFYAS